MINIHTVIQYTIINHLHVQFIFFIFLRMRNINIVVEMLELYRRLHICGDDYKITYYPFISEWKPFVKVGLQGHRARDKTDLTNRINAFELVHEHATAYFRHIDNNCASNTEGIVI
jgi:hypothetical protein